MKSNMKSHRADTKITKKQYELIEIMAKELEIKKATLVRRLIVKGLNEYFLNEE